MFRIRAYINTESLSVKPAGQSGLSETKTFAEIAHGVLLQLAQTPSVDVHLPRHNRYVKIGVRED